MSEVSAGGKSGEVNPILPGCYPDPTICRVGADYYLACSSFEYFPGAPLFHSHDLVHWEQIGHILNRRSQFRRGNRLPSTGIYAATLRHREGRFWFVTSNASDHGAGQLLVHTDDIRGPWSEPVFIPGAIGIDPDLCWDEQGQCFLTWNALDFHKSHGGILQSPLDLQSGQLSAPAYPLWQGSGLPAAEGAHLYDIEGSWYLLLAEGGTERGHCVTAARGSSPAGPFEACPHNPIFSRRSTVHPVQNAGHADLVQSPDGQWAAVYLGARPRGSTPGYHVLGRETYIAGIHWKDGWPLFETGRFEVPVAATAFVDDFRGPSLDARWVVPGSEPAAVARMVPGTGLEIFSPPGDGPAPLCVRVRDLAWRAEALLEGSGRFQLRIDDRHWYALELRNSEVSAIAHIGDIEQQLGPRRPVGGAVTLRIESVAASAPLVPLGHGGPDDIILSADAGEGVVELARLDGRYLSTEVASGFTGRMLALSSSEAGRLLVRHFSYRALD